MRRNLQAAALLTGLFGILNNPLTSQPIRVPPVRTVATLGACAVGKPRIAAVTDAQSVADCSVGGGSVTAMCACRPPLDWTSFGNAGSGTVRSIAEALSGLPWLAISGSPVTDSGTITLSPASAQTPGLVLGTCGSGTAVGLCALTAGMIPGLPYLQTPTGTGSSSTFARGDGQWAVPPTNTGPQGPQGPTGAAGATGPAGPAPSGAANLILATPDGASGVSALRAMVAADAPALPYLSNASGVTIPSAGVLQSATVQGGVASGGNLIFKTTANATKGQIVVDNWGIGYDSGDGVTFTNGSTGLEFGVGAGFGAAQVRGGAFAAKLFDNGGKGQLLLSSNGHFCLTAGADTNQTPDTCLTRNSAGVWSFDTTTDGDGAGTVRAAKVKYVPTSGVTCNSGAKGLTYVASGDGTFCSCNGTAWTPSPLTGTCN